MPSRRRHKAQPYAAAKPTVDQILQSASELKKTSVDFLKVDLQTAQTFADIAMSAQDPARRQRTRDKARQAYDTIVKLMLKIQPTEADAESLSHSLERLRSDLLRLGETF